MANPFKLDDTVYHPIYGEGIVKSCGDLSPIVNVYFDGHGILSVHHMHCSFKPWAKPNHDRPMDNGVYIVYVRASDSIQIRSLNNGKWYFVDRELKMVAHVGVEFNYYEPIKKVI